MRTYFHNDADGRCAAAIIYQTYNPVDGKDDGTGFKYIEVDYKDEIDVDEIQPGEMVYIVDFSFKPEVMERVLARTNNIIWIDHHKTAFEYKYSQGLQGIRDKDFSGCELTWKVFHPGEAPPPCVQLIGDRDKWAWKLKDTAAFNQGLHLEQHQPGNRIWKELLAENLNTDPFTKDIIESGHICLTYRDNFCKDYADSYGFETEFEGHKAYALGIYMFGSEAFGDRFKQYPLSLSYVYMGDKWQVGLYSETIDVSKIAKKYGGGGHFGAAGFVCDELPFNKS